MLKTNSASVSNCLFCRITKTLLCVELSLHSMLGIQRRIFAGPVTDFLFHSTGLYKHTDDALCDALWEFSQGNFLLWLLSKPNSRHLIRQIPAGMVHADRFSVVSSYSVLDKLLSKVLYSDTFDSPVFSSKNSNKRVFKRLMLATKRNGGIYSDINEYIRVINSNSASLQKLASKPPLSKSKIKPTVEDVEESALREFLVINPNEGEFQISFDEVRKIFEDELKVPLIRVFRSINERPKIMSNNLAVYDGELRTGEEVSLTILPPTQNRMNQIDMFPYKFISAISSVFPFFKTKKRALAYLVKRFQFSIEREVKARTQILKHYSIDVHMKPRDLFEAQQEMPFYLAAPVLKYCSKHIMVSSRQPQGKLSTLSKDTTKQLISSSADLLSKRIMIPEATARNVMITKDGKISYFKTSSAMKVMENDINVLSSYMTAMATQRDSDIDVAARIMKIKPKEFEKCMYEGTSKEPLFRSNTAMMLSSYELGQSISEAYRNNKCEKEILQPIANVLSQHTRIGVEHEILRYLDTVANKMYD